MVHALREAQRVVRTGGVIVDLRPVATDAAIEVVTPNEVVRVGTVDGSPGKPHDDATNRALAASHLARLRHWRFEVAIYWDSVDEMVTRLAGSTRHLEPTLKDIGAAREKFDANNGSRLRYHEAMVLTTYRA